MKNEAEYKKALKEIAELMSKSKLTKKEDKYLESIFKSVEIFEQEKYTLPKLTAEEMAKYLKMDCL